MREHQHWTQIQRSVLSVINIPDQKNNTGLIKPTVNCTNLYLCSWVYVQEAGLGRVGLWVKQLHGYSDRCTRSGVIVGWSERGDLQQHNAPLSYQRSVATTQGAWPSKDYFLPFPFEVRWVQTLRRVHHFSKTTLFLKGRCFSTHANLLIKSSFHALFVKITPHQYHTDSFLSLLPIQNTSGTW